MFVFVAISASLEFDESNKSPEERSKYIQFVLDDFPPIQHTVKYWQRKKNVGLISLFCLPSVYEENVTTTQPGGS